MLQFQLFINCFFYLQCFPFYCASINFELVAGVVLAGHLHFAALLSVVADVLFSKMFPMCFVCVVLCLSYVICLMFVYCLILSSVIFQFVFHKLAVKSYICIASAKFMVHSCIQRSCSFIPFPFPDNVSICVSLCCWFA